MGNARVRPPRMELTGAELDDALTVIREALANRPEDFSRSGAATQH